MTYANGSVYDGDWKNGDKDGQGKMTYANGSVYDGDWKNGDKDGIGKLMRPMELLFTRVTL